MARVQQEHNKRKIRERSLPAQEKSNLFLFVCIFFGEIFFLFF